MSKDDTTKDDTTKSDTHSKSLSEVLINTFGGYPIGYLVGIIVLPASIGWIQEDPFVANAVITFVFATASFVRMYFLRRVFERFGYDDNLIRLAIRLRNKIRDR